MPDISMCGSETCPIRDLCYRNPLNGAKPHERQSWMFFSGSREDARDCDGWWPISDEASEKAVDRIAEAL